MEIKDLLIALMAFSAFGLVIFSFVGTFYSPENLNVDVSGTQFDKMYNKMNETRQGTDAFVSDFSTYAPGGTNTTVDNADISTADLVRSSLKALGLVPRTFTIFTSMVMTIGETLHIDSVVVGFLIGVVIITLLIILTTAVLKWNSS